MCSSVVDSAGVGLDFASISLCDSSSAWTFWNMGNNSGWKWHLGWVVIEKSNRDIYPRIVGIIVQIVYIWRRRHFKIFFRWLLALLVLFWFHQKRCPDEKSIGDVLLSFGVAARESRHHFISHSYIHTEWIYTHTRIHLLFASKYPEPLGLLRPASTLESNVNAIRSCIRFTTHKGQLHLLAMFLSLIMLFCMLCGR